MKKVENVHYEDEINFRFDLIPRKVICFVGSLPLIYISKSFLSINMLLTAGDHGIICFMLHDKSNNEVVYTS